MFGFILSCAALSLPLTVSGGLETSCGKYEFPCNDGTCIGEDFWCDGEPDCPDDSDEIYCLKISSYNKDPNDCPANLFKCNDGPCVPLVGRCDGIVHCEDKSDEENCLETKPQTYERSSRHVKPVSSVRIRSTYDANQRSVPNKTSINIAASPPYKTNYEESSDSPELYKPQLDHQRKLAVDWLISQRKADYGWGDETHRALIALYLCCGYPFSKNETNMLMVKQLDIQLSIEIARNSTHPMTLTDLSLYVNALFATCRSPKNFHGYNLVNTLRNRVNFAQNTGIPVSPFVYLTLCINNATTYNDLKKLIDITSRPHLNKNKFDIFALTLLAASCVTKVPTYGVNARIRSDSLHEIFQKLKNEGLPGNVYEMALLIQALNEVRVKELTWNRSAAMKFIKERQNPDGSFGDILATYYVLPILSGKSLLSLNNHCDHSLDSDLTPIEVLQNTKRKRILVQYYLFYGNPIEMSQMLKIKVAEGTNFLDVMRLAQESNPSYRFRFDDRTDKPFVYSIGGIPNDAERGLYWILYTRTNNTSPEIETDPDPFTGNIKSLIPKEGDKMVFWMKPV